MADHLIEGDDPVVLFKSAINHHSAGRLEEAMALYRRLMDVSPGDYRVHGNFAAALRRLGRPAEALASYDRAIALNPAAPEVHSNRANALRDLGRYEEALDAVERALSLSPGTAEFHVNRGNVLRDMDRPGEALASYDAALAANSKDPEAHKGRGIVLDDLGRPADALASFDAALALRPDDPQAHNNRAKALNELGRPAEALRSVERALALRPNLATAHSNKGSALLRLGRLEEAEASLGRAIALDPSLSQAYLNRSMCALMRGDFPAGWKDYEHRWDANRLYRDATRVDPRLRARLETTCRASDLAGRRVLLLGEQGPGDVLMFASILPDVLATARSVSLVCDPRLWRLLSNSFPDVALLHAAAAGEQVEGFDVVLGMGSLGRLYRTRIGDFPGTPYLSPRPEVRDRWAVRLGPAKGLRRIGISWKGGVARTRRVERSLPLTDLRPILDLPDCETISLQYGENAQEVATASAALARPIRLFEPAELDDFEELAGLVANLDLVVSVQTSLVHLCGAIGAPCFAMVPTPPEWRYAGSGSTMSWYRSVTLFRQDAPGAWPPVVARVAEAAAAAPRAGPRP